MLARLRTRRVRADDDYLPRVCVIVAAYNEEPVIERRLANLRALGPKYTLVLLNGRRVANIAFGNNPVDLNSIPYRRTTVPPRCLRRLPSGS